MPMTITHAKSDSIANFTGTVTVGNSSGGTVTVAATDLVRAIDWNSAHATTLSLTGAEIASLFSFNAPGLSSSTNASGVVVAANFTFGSGLSSSTNATGIVVGASIVIGGGLSSTTNATGITAGVASVGFYEPFPPANTNSSLSAPGIGTWYFDPMDDVPSIGSGQINILMADALAFLAGAVYSAAVTGSVTKNQTLNLQLAIYRLGTGASTSRLESVWSADASMLATQQIKVSSASSNSFTVSNLVTVSFPAQWNSSGGVTYSSTTASGSVTTASTTMASTQANSLITAALAYVTGSRMHIFPFSTSLTPGAYWMAHMFSSTSSTTGTGYGAGTLWSTQSLVHMLEFVAQAYKQLGQSVSNTSTGMPIWHGSYASTSTSPPSVVNTSDMRNLLTQARMYWNYAQSTY